MNSLNSPFSNYSLGTYHTVGGELAWGLGFRHSAALACSQAADRLTQVAGNRWTHCTPAGGIPRRCEHKWGRCRHSPRDEGQGGPLRREHPGRAQSHRARHAGVCREQLRKRELVGKPREAGREHWEFVQVDTPLSTSQVPHILPLPSVDRGCHLVPKTQCARDDTVEPRGAAATRPTRVEQRVITGPTAPCQSRFITEHTVLSNLPFSQKRRLT